MKRLLRMRARILPLLAPLAPLAPLLAGAVTRPATAEAQLIQVRTVPVAAGDQFLLFPSENLGMGGVSIALEDRFLDPFVNPAKGARLQGAHLFASPAFSGVSGDNGAARTLPLGALFRGPSWFGGLALALQQLEAARFGSGPIILREFGFSQDLLSDRSSTNMYAFGMIGRKLPGSRFSVAGSFFWADLDAVAGVELLYALSQKVEQFGHMLDSRVGLYGEWNGGRSLEAVLVFNDFDVTHNVSYLDWIWPLGTPQTRLERNFDRSRTWGLHLGYVHPLPRSGWQVGGILTVNRKTHPEIPNYEIVNIPRDPGHSWASNLGLGLSRSWGAATFGVDLIYEPIWSHTWAEAEAPVQTLSGRTIPAGGRTVDNDFRFSNGLLRIGVRREEDPVGLQLGLQMRAMNYRLEQENHVEESRRAQEEGWVEWTPTWGVSVKFPEFQVRYAGQLTTGTGRPGVAWGGDRVQRFTEGAAMSDFIVAPGGPLTLQEARVLTHQISILMPIGP